MVSGGGKRHQDRGSATGVFPASRQLVWHSSFAHDRSRHDAIVRGHTMAHQLEVVLPTAVGAELAGSLQWETGFFYELTAPLAVLLSPRFIAEYVLEGSLYMVAKNVAADAHNSAMVLPSGELLLLVDAETYAQLGLVGHTYTSGRYVVSIDLTSRAFATGDPSAVRDRVVGCLAAKFEPLAMVLCAYNARGAPRTVVFGDDDSLERTRVEVNGALDRMRGVAVPALDQVLCGSVAHDKSQMAALRSALERAYDWLGVVACRLPELLQRDAPREEYVSGFDVCGHDGGHDGEVSVVRWRGLMGAEFTQRVLDRVRDSVATGSLPWAAVTVWGVADALVSWRQEYDVPLSRAQEKKQRKHHQQQQHGGGGGSDAKTTTTTPKQSVNREHGYLLNGHNNYTFLVLPQHEYYVLQELGPHDATM